MIRRRSDMPFENCDDPGRRLIAEVLLLAVSDLINFREGRISLDPSSWAGGGWCGDKFDDLLEFFGSRDFDGLCYWLDIDPDAARERLKVQKTHKQGA